MSNNTTRGRGHTLPPTPDYLPCVELLLRESVVSLRNCKELLKNHKGIDINVE